MELPNDPFILMSFVNMKLRDYYHTLDEMCDDMGLNRCEIEDKLAEAGFHYDENQMRFW